MTTVNVTKIGFTTTKNLELPPPSQQMRVGSYVLNWALGSEFAFDLQYLQYSGEGITPQGMEIDNSTGAQEVTVTIPNALNWSRTIAPFSRRTFMIPAVDNLQFNVTSTAGVGTAALYLYGFPVMPDAETAGGGNAYVPDNADGIVPVATPTFLATLSRVMGYDGAQWDRVRLALESADAIAPNATAVLESLARLSGYNGASFDRLRALSDNADAQAPATLGALLSLLCAQWFDGTNWNRKREATVYATVLASALGSTAIYTPAVGLYYRLLGYSMELTENSSLAAAAILNAQFYDVAAAIPIAHSFFVPAAAVAGQGMDPVSPMALGQGYKSAAAATALNINLSAAIVGGALRVNVALAVGINA